MQKALQSVDDRATGIVDEWIRLVEIPSPSGNEQARAKYIDSRRSGGGRHRREFGRRWKSLVLARSRPTTCST
jgi:hypothetical protein